MKTIKYFLISILLLNTVTVFGQTASYPSTKKNFPLRKLTTEPAIGLHPMPTSDLVLSNVLQYNLKKQLNLVAYSSYNRNAAFLRNFNFVKTNYNFSLTQKFGIGTTVYGKHFSHTFSLLAGLKYDAYKETLQNPEFEKVSVAASSLSPDFGLMYNMKIGKKKYFFSYRMYIPLYPYPIKTADVSSIDGNMASTSIEVGVGIRLK